MQLCIFSLLLTITAGELTNLVLVTRHGAGGKDNAGRLMGSLMEPCLNTHTVNYMIYFYEKDVRDGNKALVFDIT